MPLCSKQCLMKVFNVFFAVVSFWGLMLFYKYMLVCGGEGEERNLYILLIKYAISLVCIYQHRRTCIILNQVANSREILNNS